MDGRSDGWEGEPREGSLLDLGKALNAISRSPEGDKIVAAGRDVLKIYDVRPYDTNQVFHELESLRPSARNVGLTYSTVDVQWHPTDTNKIATAATNGHVVIWNVLVKDGRTQRQERVIKDHKGTVHRLTWHPVNSYNILSGSHDGTMKLWDIRDPNAKVITFDANSTSVRDVQFNPFYSNYFGAAFDNGTVQVWDMRKPSTFERRFTAHEGLVMTICWHPEERSIIASGGRDRLIKVWDLNPRASNPKQTIQTVFSVGRLQWQPGNPTRIASAASLFDCQIHVWDTSKPYIPLSSFTGHRDVVTGFIWHKSLSDCVIACSKDGTLRCHSLKEAYRPYQHIRTVGLSWNVRNELANFYDHVDRDNPTAEYAGSSSATAAATKLNTSIFSRGVPHPSKEKKPYTKASGIIKVHTPLQMQTVLFDHQSFQHLAHSYRYVGTFTEICEHNAKMASMVKQFQVAQSWMVLKTLYADIDAEPLSATPLRVNSDLEQPSPTPKVAYTPKQNALSSSIEALPVVESMDDFLLPQEVSEDAMHRSASQEGGLQNKRTFALTDSSGGLPFTTSALGTGATIEGMGSIPLRRSTGTTTALRHTNMITLGKGEGGVLDIHSITATPFPPAPPPPPVSPPSRLHATTSDESDQDVSGSDGSHQDRGYTADMLGRSENNGHPSPLLDEAELDQIPQVDDIYSGAIARWCYESVVRDMLEFYGSQGDVQTCVAMALVLQGHLQLDKKTMTQWFLSYIELLHRFQLWSVANSIIRICPIDDIRAINQKSTTVHTSCPTCGRPLFKVGWACEHCNKPTNTCSVCHQIVKGIYVWCQGCGHGGHIQHMYQWFEKQKQSVCPAACAHLCTARDFALAS